MFGNESIDSLLITMYSHWRTQGILIHDNHYPLIYFFSFSLAKEHFNGKPVERIVTLITNIDVVYPFIIVISMLLHHDKEGAVFVSNKCPNYVIYY